METKFTKGEWVTHYDGVCCGGVLVARKTGREKTAGEGGANLNLIAAAPEMYAELDDLEAWLKYHDDYKGWHNRVKKLLEKARGEL